MESQKIVEGDDECACFIAFGDSQVVKEIVEDHEVWQQNYS